MAVFVAACVSKGGRRGILHLLAQPSGMHGAIACCPAEEGEV